MNKQTYLVGHYLVGLLQMTVLAALCEVIVFWVICDNTQVSHKESSHRVHRHNTVPPLTKSCKGKMIRPFFYACRPCQNIQKRI